MFADAVAGRHSMSRVELVDAEEEAFFDTVEAEEAVVANAARAEKAGAKKAAEENAPSEKAKAGAAVLGKEALFQEAQAEEEAFYEAEEALDSAEAGTSGEHERGPPRDAAEDARLLEQAREFKECGNAHFKAGDLPEALECYTQAIDASAPTRAEEVGTFFANRAAVFSRMGQHQA